MLKRLLHVNVAKIVEQEKFKILPSEFKHRRDKLTQCLKYDPHCLNLVLISGNTKQYKMRDVPYKFRQSSNFQYLVGHNKPNSHLVMLDDHGVWKSYLFVNKLNAEQEIWEGPNESEINIAKETSVEIILDTKYLHQFLLDKVQHEKTTFYLDDVDESSSSKRIINKLAIEQPSKIKSLHSIDKPLQNLRSIKSHMELMLIQRACHIGCVAMTKTISSSYPNISETVLETRFDLEAKMAGSDPGGGLAYIPVVGGGERACTIHYIDNNQLVPDNSLVLMDAGCEFQGYCSDISRTWPIQGRFTPPQKELYSALLDVQERCIQACHPGQITLNELLHYMYKLMIQNFQEIKLIPSHLSPMEKLQMVYKLCPHHIGHHLGLDIHDCHSISRDNPLQPGMVITVEPGVYIRSNYTEFPKELRGMGIRIEDDIIITSNEGEGNDGTPINMTRECPKKPLEIESLLAK